MVGTLSQSDYRWGPSANQITGVPARVACAGDVRARVVHPRVVGTLSQSDYTGVARNGCTCKGGGDTQTIRLHRGCAQGLHAQEWWGHSANLITQGLHARVAHTGVVHKGCPCRGCMQGVHVQGLCMQGLLFVLGYHWLPLATIDLVGDNREFEV